MNKKRTIFLNPKNKGKLHEAAHKPKDEKFSAEELEDLKESQNPLTRKRATFALNAKSWAGKGQSDNDGDE